MTIALENTEEQSISITIDVSKKHVQDMAIVNAIEKQISILKRLLQNAYSTTVQNNSKIPNSFVRKITTGNEKPKQIMAMANALQNQISYLQESLANEYHVNLPPDSEIYNPSARKTTKSKRLKVGEHNSNVVNR